MDEFLRRAPRTVLALVAIVIGYALIIGFNPPRTVCDEQMDVVLESQKSFLSPSSEKIRKTAATELYELCKSDNGPGGCFDFFLNLRSMADGLERVPKTCAETVGANELIQNWIFKSITLMTQIAWGDSNAGVYISRKHSWLDASDFRLFCRLKALAVRFYGEDAFQAFRESVLSSLPGADKMTREQKWSRSIFSSSCNI